MIVITFVSSPPKSAITWAILAFVYTQMISSTNHITMLKNLSCHMVQVIQMNIQEDIRKQIVQELKINQAAQCPHIVVCYHSFYHNGAISLVLEYMDRGSLADVVRQVKTILEPYLAVVCKQVSGFCR